MLLSVSKSFPIHSVILFSATPRIYRELASMLQSSPETGIGGDPEWLSLAGSGQNADPVMVPRAGNHTQKREKSLTLPTLPFHALPKTGTGGAHRCPGSTTAGGCVQSCLEKGKWALKTQDRLQPMKWLGINLFHLAFEKVSSRECFRSRSQCLPERLDTMARCICSTNSKLNLSPSPLSPHSTGTNGTQCQARKLNIPFDFILHSSSFPHYMASHVSFSHLDTPFF